MKDTLLELLKLETTSDRPDELRKAIDLVQSFFADSKVYIKQYLVKEKPSIVVTSKFTKKPKIMFSGHVDVVFPLKEGSFMPYEKGKKLYARGASDMKGCDVAMMYAFKELISEEPDLDIGLMITSDEEIGGFNGTDYLLNKAGYSASVAFVPDGGDNWKICSEEKGVWHIKIETKGVSSHGSRPWLGENALEKAMQIYSEIKSEFHNRFGKPTLENNWVSTVNLGVLKGGESTNLVPDYAEMKLDIRHTADVDIELLRKIVSPIVKQGGGKLESMVYGNPSHTSEGHPALQRWKKIVKESVGLNADFYKTHGASDGRYFSAKGIPVLTAKPYCSEPHIADEWIDYKSLEEFKEVIKEWVVQVVKEV